MSQDPERQLLDLPSNAWALLGLLSFDDALTGYELKQRADITLRFYWQSPAMSQVYSELARLTAHGLLAHDGEGRGRRYRLTAAGQDALRRWLCDTTPGFPIWRHPVALRMMIGHLTDDAALVAMLRTYATQVEAAQADLEAVLAVLLGTGSTPGTFRNPALVAEWGIAHFSQEAEHVRRLADRLEVGIDRDPDADNSRGGQ